MINNIQKKYEQLFGDNYSIYRAPGRINLLGEHTDYNDGFVLPASINKEMIFAIGKNYTNSTCNFFAYDFSESYSLDLTKISPGNKSWANYIKGVIAEIIKKNKTIKGFDLVFGGNIPLGAGLSSSAALESGVAIALNDMFSLGFKKIELVKMAQMAEHNYAGVKCGIMDQFTSIMGKEKSAIKLDCRTLEFNYFPLVLENYKIILCNTQIKHSLAFSEYNTRRLECQKGVSIIQNEIPNIINLRDVSLNLLFSFKDKIPKTIFNRCSYIIEENNRVLKATKLLSEYKIKEFGKLMYETHDGLSNKYEVSCDELDFLVDLTKNLEYVVGSRMIGGGFGGCTINLVHRNNINKFNKLVLNRYRKTFRTNAIIYKVKITNGAGKSKNWNGD